MSAKLLDFVPPSGSYPEHHFGEHFHDKLWVEFDSGNDTKWLGCFARPRYPAAFDKVVIDLDGACAFVIAGGIGYLIDIENRRLIYQSHEYPLFESAISTTAPDYFIASTHYSILIFDHNGLKEEVSPDYQVYGIYVTTQVGNAVTGDMWSYMYGDINVGFTLNLIDFSMSIDETIKVKRDGPLEYTTVRGPGSNENKTQGLLSKLLKYLLG